MSLIALILGAGPGLGQSIAKKLIGEGYKVAAASRNPDLSIAKEIGFHPLKTDLSNPEDIPKVFAEVQKEFGGFPNVVVYNGNPPTHPSLPLGTAHNSRLTFFSRIAWAGTFAADPEDILSTIPTKNLASEFNVNTLSFWAAAQETVVGWEKVDSALPKAFIYTGNLLPWINMPKYVSLGIGKASSAHIVESLASTYGKRGFRYVKKKTTPTATTS